MAHFRDICCHLGHTEASGTAQGGVDIFVEPVSGQDYYLRPAPADIGRRLHWLPIGVGVSIGVDGKLEVAVQVALGDLSIHRLDELLVGARGDLARDRALDLAETIPVVSLAR